MTDQLLDEILPEAKEYKYAGFWTRFGASFIDGLILIPLNVSYFLVFINASLIWVSFLCTVIAAIYKPYLEVTRGSTWGKDALGIKVLKLNGDKIGVNEGLKRWILPFGLSGLVGIASVLMLALSIDPETEVTAWEIMAQAQSKEGALNVLNIIASLASLIFGISIAIDKKSRGLHDQIGGTMVVFK